MINFLAITSKPQRFEGQSKARKAHIIALFLLKTWIKKLAFGVGTQ